MTQMSKAKIYRKMRKEDYLLKFKRSFRVQIIERTEIIGANPITRIFFKRIISKESNLMMPNLVE
jgi:hypothetical protein